MLALLLGAGVIYALMIWNGSSYDGEWAPQLNSARDLLYGAFMYITAYGGWLWLNLRFVSLESLRSLNLAPGTLLGDLGAGWSLFFLDLVSSPVVDGVIREIPGYYETSAYSDMVISETTGGPFMLFATLVYSWTAAAIFEELLRSFTISRILRLSTAASARVLAVAISTILFGCYHLYYGPYGAASVAVSGLILGTYYVMRGRILPLIIAHGLYGTYVTWAMFYYAQYGQP